MSPVCKDQAGECSVCLKQDTKTRSTRHNSKVNWILCDCCNKWLHASCGGITTIQYTKIRKDNIWYKCIICCVQQILLTDSSEDSTSILNSAVDSARSRIQQSQSQTGSKKKGGKRSSDNLCPDSPAQGTGYTSIATPSGNPCDPVYNICQDNTSYGNTATAGTVSDSFSLSESAPYSDISNRICVGDTGTNDTESTRCTDIKEESQNSLHVSNRLVTDCVTLNSSKCDIGLQGTSTNNSIVFENSSVADKIVIIDNINNPIEFNSSQRILQEIRNFCPEVKIE